MLRGGGSWRWHDEVRRWHRGGGEELGDSRRYIRDGGGNGSVFDELEGLPPDGAAVVALQLAIAVEEQREGLDIVVEAELVHGPQHVLGGDGLALLSLAPLVGLAGDEADVLGDALLDHLLGVVRDLGVGRQHPAHDADHVGDRHEAILLTHDGRGGGSCCGSRVQLHRRILDQRNPGYALTGDSCSTSDQRCNQLVSLHGRRNMH